MTKAKIIIVEDEIITGKELETTLKIMGYQVIAIAKSAEEAIQKVKIDRPDLVLMDIQLNDQKDGIEVAQVIKRRYGVPSIFITANSDDERIERVKLVHPYGYLIKPIRERDLKITIELALYASKVDAKRSLAEKNLKKAYAEIEETVKARTAELEKLKQHLLEKNIYLQEEIKLIHNYSDIIGNSKKILNVLKMVNKVADLDSTVLLLGETGTGKGLLANLVHELSHRKDQILVTINCAALPVSLIESELFGHERGAFTGADARKIGRFELADKGTIFLDEIGDLSLEVQVKLLRIIQDGEFERLGSSVTQKVDIRLITATHKDLEKLCFEGKFREDLFYRLHVFPITIPPLRERKDDIPLLVNHFLKINNQKTGKKIDMVPQSVMDYLVSYNWPGNIRELKNIIERAVILSPGNQLRLDDWATQNTISSNKEAFLTLDESQKEHILRALKLTRGKIFGKGGAAMILGIKPTTLQSRMRKLGIEIDESRS